jgi:hypothetical protein
MIIRNNTVYNNNGTAIICSLNCYNIVYGFNKVYNNNGAGISFSRNTTGSVARYNYITNQETPIELSASNNNQVYGNIIINSPTSGITVKAGSSDNKIYSNTIKNTKKDGIEVRPDSQKNNIYFNNIDGKIQKTNDDLIHQ